MSQAMIRGMQDEDNDQFVAYFLPTDDTLEKRDSDKRLGVDYEDDVTYDYKLTKEYNWNVKNKASKGYEENFFFCYRPGEGENEFHFRWLNIKGFESNHLIQHFLS